MSDFNSIWVQIVTLKLSLISDPVSGDFAQIVSGLRRRKKSEKWHAYLEYTQPRGRGVAKMGQQYKLLM